MNTHCLLAVLCCCKLGKVLNYTIIFPVFVGCKVIDSIGPSPTLTGCMECHLRRMACNTMWSHMACEFPQRWGMFAICYIPLTSLHFVPTVIVYVTAVRNNHYFFVGPTLVIDIQWKIATEISVFLSMWYIDRPMCSKFSATSSLASVLT